MCELFGVSARRAVSLNRYLKEFFSHSADHPNGWGLAFFHGNAASVEKEPLCASDSMYLRARLRARIESRVMFAHIRKATKGHETYPNTHPFIGRDRTGRLWTLIHNGTVFECGALDSYVRVQEGDTDSERILLYLLNSMNAAEQEKGAPLEAEERFSVVAACTEIIAPGNKVNYLLYDGELLYAHANVPDGLHVLRRGEGAVFSTVPLSGEPFESVPLNTVQAFREGELVFRAAPHPYVYTEDPEKMRLLFLEYAEL